jgi:hypothetical protein
MLLYVGGPIMAKKATEAKTTSSQDEAKQQRKKLAKREAKLMLQIGRVQKDMHKAEQKIAKAQANLEATRTNLQDFEDKLVHVRTLLEASNGHASANVDAAPAEAESVAEVVAAQETAAIIEPAASSADLEAVISAEVNDTETNGSVEEESESPTEKPLSRRRPTSRTQPKNDSDDASSKQE